MATVNLTWTDNSSDEDGFYVYRTTTDSPTFPDDYTQITEVGIDTTSYSDTNAPDDERVYYAVTAHKSTIESSETTDIESTFVIDGTVSAGGSSVQGATVFVVDTTNETEDFKETTDSNGYYATNPNPNQGPFHVAAQYDDGSTTYNAKSSPYNSTPSKTIDFDLSSYTAPSPENVNFVGATVPPAPSNLTSTGGSDQVSLSWTDNSSNEDGFYVYRAQSSGSTTGDYTQVADLAANTTSYNDTGLEDGEQYFYRVSAYNTEGESSLSNETNSIVDLPAASNVTLDTTTEDEIGVSWTRNDDSPDGSWEIYISEDGSLGTVETTISTLSTTSYTVTSLKDGATYYVTIRRVTDHTSSDSAQQSATTLLPAPTDASLISLNGDQVTTTVTDNADEKDGYRVYLSPDGYLEFDGSDLSNVTGPGDWSSIGTGDFTIVAVARWDDLSRDSANLGQSIFTDNGSNSYDLNIYAGNGAIRTYNGSSAAWSGPEGEFVTVAARRIGTTRELYGNGQVRDTISDSVDITSSGGYIFGVSEDETASKSLDGAIERLAVYPDSLTDSEIDGFGNGEAPNSVDPIIHLEFADGSGTTVEDSSGNGNHGTVNNGTSGVIWNGGGSWTQDNGDLPPKYAARFDPSDRSTMGSANQSTIDVVNNLNFTVCSRFTIRGMDNNANWPDLIGFSGDNIRIEVDQNSASRVAMYINDDDESPSQWYAGQADVSPPETLSVIFSLDGDISNDSLTSNVYKNGNNVMTETFGNSTLNQQTWDGGITINSNVDIDFDIDNIEIYSEVFSDSDAQDWHSGNVSYSPEASWQFDNDWSEEITGNTGSVTNGTPTFIEPIEPVRYTTSSLLDGEKYVLQWRTFTADAGEVIDR